MGIASYSPPVDKLLTLGDCRNFRGWPNYLELGLGPEHIPDLIRMAIDDELNWAASDSLEVWAPVHAWRALGQLHAEAAVEPLMRLLHELEGSDWPGEELPKVYGMIGAAAIPALTAYLADKSHGWHPRAVAAESLEQIGKMHPEVRAECVAALTRQLEQFAEDDPTLNSFVICSLIGLKAVESAPMIERTFTANCVERFVVGDWEDVQVSLGLREARGERPKRGSTSEFLLRLSSLADRPPLTDQEAAPQQQAEHKAKAKAKRKMAEKSRKRNRKQN